jgi:hypothetical protein
LGLRVWVSFLTEKMRAFVMSQSEEQLIEQMNVVYREVENFMSKMQELYGIGTMVTLWAVHDINSSRSAAQTKGDFYSCYGLVKEFVTKKEVEMTIRSMGH